MVGSSATLAWTASPASEPRCSAMVGRKRRNKVGTNTRSDSRCELMVLAAVTSSVTVAFGNAGVDTVHIDSEKDLRR